MLHSVSQAPTPSHRPDRSDAHLIALGARFVATVKQMLAAEKKSNALCRKAHRLASNLAGVGNPPKGRAESERFLDRLAEAETRIGGVNEASDTACRLSDEVGRLADEIATIAPMSIEGARVHARVVQALYLQNVGEGEQFDPDAHYNGKIVRSFVSALLTEAPRAPRIAHSNHPDSAVA